MSETVEEKNKALVLEAFDTLFNRRDYAAAEKFWSPDYIQHSAHIPPGRDGLFNLIKASRPSLRYEHGLIMAEAISLSCTGDIQTPVCRRTGLSPISSESKTGFWPNIGT